jgi:hypothetical protein
VRLAAKLTGWKIDVRSAYAAPAEEAGETEKGAVEDTENREKQEKNKDIINTKE